MAFPTSLDSLKSTWLPGERPIGHAAHHNSMAILLYAIQSKVGINGSADTSSLDYKVTALTSALASGLATKANLTGGNAFTGNQTVNGTISADGVISTTMTIGNSNTQSGQVLQANGLDHIYFAWLVNLVRKAYMGFAAAGLTTLNIVNEQTNGDIDMTTNGTGKVKANGVNVMTDEGIVTDTDGTTITFNIANGRKRQVTLGGNRTLAVSNVAVGQYFAIDLIQDGTGSRTVTWFSGIKWAGGTAPTLTTTASKKDKFVFFCESAGSYQGFVAGKNI